MRVRQLSRGMSSALLATLVISLSLSVWWHRRHQPTGSKRGSFGLSTSALWTRDRSRLAIVLPFTAGDVEHQLDNMELWVEMGAPTRPQDAGKVDLMFYYNRLEDKDATGLLEHPRFLEAWKTLSKSFKSYSVVYANLTDVEDIYPAGPSNMFFKLFLDNHLRSLIAPYVAVYWMEWDVFPIRPHWASQLLLEASGGEPFWQKGSIYLGRAFDGSVTFAFNWGWVAHINGNALYASDDQEWRTFLEMVMDQEPPNHYWKPFDVSIAKVFRHLPYAWQWQQKFSGRFQYSDFVVHYGFTILDEQIQQALQNPDTFLIHGKRGSAGKVKYDDKMGNTAAISQVQWGDEVPVWMKLSVLIRSWRGDVEYAVLAALSASIHVANALELVIVVPEEDLALFKTKSWPANTILKGEPDLLPNGHIQQKYTKLMADEYCRGDYILHLDSDTVIYRPVLRKDLIWEGRPSVLYAPYDTLPEAAQAWKEGTSSAMAFPVEHEFSRSAVHMYHRSTYPHARKYIEDVHGTSFVKFLSTRIGKNVGVLGTTEEMSKRYFSDFNYLGAYLYYQEHESITWVPAWEEPRNSALFPILPPFICQGNARLATAVDLAKGNMDAVAELRKRLTVAISSGRCFEVDDLVQRWEAWATETMAARKQATGH